MGRAYRATGGSPPPIEPAKCGMFGRGPPIWRLYDCRTVPFPTAPGAMAVRPRGSYALRRDTHRPHQPGPDQRSRDVVIEPPGAGAGFWAGGPSVVNEDGVFHLAYRLRRPVDQGRGYANVVARSTDGVHFETVATVWPSTFDCASLERPALIRRPDGGWRLYVSCSTPGSKHWWVEAVDTPAGGEPADLQTGGRTVVLPGSDGLGVEGRRGHPGRLRTGGCGPASTCSTRARTRPTGCGRCT